MKKSLTPISYVLSWAYRNNLINSDFKNVFEKKTNNKKFDSIWKSITNYISLTNQLEYSYNDKVKIGEHKLVSLWAFKLNPELLKYVDAEKFYKFLLASKYKINFLLDNQLLVESLLLIAEDYEEIKYMIEAKKLDKLFRIKSQFLLQKFMLDFVKSILESEEEVILFYKIYEKLFSEFPLKSLFSKSSTKKKFKMKLQDHFLKEFKREFQIIWNNQKTPDEIKFLIARFLIYTNLTDSSPKSSNDYSKSSLRNTGKNSLKRILR